MYTDISKETKKVYRITTPGVHTFYFHNKSGDLTFDIKNEKAIVYVYGLYEAGGSDKYELNITQKHTVASAQSHVLIKGIFDDASRFTFTGTIIIGKNGSGTDATLENRNLLVSEKAHVKTSPALRITPHDVTCMHAATVSYIDEEQRDYLMMRGLNKSQAEKSLIQGFKDDLLSKLEK